MSEPQTFEVVYKKGKPAENASKTFRLYLMAIDELLSDQSESADVA